VALASALKRLLVPVVAVLAVIPTATVLSTTAPAAASTGSVSTSAAAADEYEVRVQRQVNRVRRNHELPRLRLASCTDRVAERWSDHLALTSGFYHQSMTDLLDECSATYAGETLGRGTMTPRGLVRLWMNSPPHRAVLLSPKPRRIGVGATADVTGRWVVAANFMRF
jgi:uncharacterized protein YkwD